jgi:hypothetical protein
MNDDEIRFALYLLWFFSLFPFPRRAIRRFSEAGRTPAAPLLREILKMHQKQPDRVSQAAADQCGYNADRFAGSSHLPGEAPSGCPPRPSKQTGDHFYNFLTLVAPE